MRAEKRITSDYVAQLPFATDAKKPIFIWDSELKGFGIKVTTTNKRYFAEAKVFGRTCRRAIDAYTVINAEDARRRAKILLGKMHQGIDPNQEKKEELQRGMTFEEVCAEYLRDRDLAPRTQRDYLYHMRKTFADWLPRSYLKITRSEAAKLFQVASEKSAAQGNQAFRFARAVFKFARIYRDSNGNPQLKENPIDVISEGRKWKRVPGRKSYIKDHQLKLVWEALWALKNDNRYKDRETARDFLILLLFTGLRHTEGLNLRWEDVDFDAQTFTIPVTKNHEPHVLPFSDYLFSFFENRKQITSDSPWVFPSFYSNGERPLTNISRVLEIVNSESGVAFIPHDLRRTFLTIAKQVPGRYNVFLIKRLANHKVADITSDYVQIDDAEFRKCMQEITDYILDKSGARASQIGMPARKAPPPEIKRRVNLTRRMSSMIEIGGE